MKRVVIIVSLLLMIVGVSACQTKAKEEETMPAQAINPTVLEGNILIIGSTSVEKIGLAVGDAFTAQNPGVTIAYESVGSSAGIKAAAEKVADLGTASRNLKDKEKEAVESKVIAYDGVAVIVHPSNQVRDLTVDQLKAIFKGEITDWAQIGGAAEKIVVVSREDGSGTRGAFEEIVGFAGELLGTATIAEGNGNVQQTVAGNPNAIGYVSFAYINDQVSAIKIDGVNPGEEEVLQQKYPISRPFLMVYHPQKLNGNEPAKAFLEYILSTEGQDIVAANHGIRVDGKK